MCVYLCANIVHMAAPKFFLEHRKDKKTNLPIIMKYSFRGDRVEFYTGIRCDADDFIPNSKEPVKKTAIDAEMKNDLAGIILNHMDSAIIAAKATGTPVSKEYFKNYLNEKLKAKEEVQQKAVTFFQFCDIFIAGMRNGINRKTGHPLSHANVEKYSATKNMLIEFCKHRKKEIDWPDFDRSLYDEIVQYMITKKGYALNTYGRHIKFIKTILHDAVEKGHNNHHQFIKSFKGVTEASDSVYLTKEELNTFAAYDFAQWPRWERTRDIFLIGCWTGLRYSDYSRLRKENISGGMIRITQQKTKQPVIVPLHPVVVGILEKYNYELPPAISNQKFNDYLKEAAEKAGLNSPFTKTITKGGKPQTTQAPKWTFISSHCARRTFATNAFEAGIPPSLIMSITGHRTESEFMKYIKLSAEKRAQMFATLAKW